MKEEYARINSITTMGAIYNGLSQLFPLIVYVVWLVDWIIVVNALALLVSCGYVVVGFIMFVLVVFIISISFFTLASFLLHLEHILLT